MNSDQVSLIHDYYKAMDSSQNHHKITSPIFVAEVSANHLGSKSRALEIVEAAAESGATAVKFQTYTAETMTLNLTSSDFRVKNDHPLWPGRTLFSLYEEAFTPWEWHEELFQKCRELGVIPFSSPFDLSAVNFLETLKCPMYKIASLETSDHILIKAVAKTKKPVIISTGATELEEIESLVKVFKSTGNSNLTLLVCTSNYPSLPKDAHLARIKTLKNKFDVNVGISDHTLGIGASIAGITLGATVVEKHFTLRRKDGGADSAFSMEPEEFKALVVEGMAAFESIGNPSWEIPEVEFESRRLRRSLYVVRDVKQGEKVSFENVRAIRPGYGLRADHFESLLGLKFTRDISSGTPMSMDLVN
jgi:pseudaminic acid synthase